MKIVKDRSYQLTPRYKNQFGNFMEVTAEVSWESSNPAIVSVNDTGLISAKSQGHAVITHTIPSLEKSQTINIEVEDPILTTILIS
jgi:uncharacterized protein YjdB